MSLSSTCVISGKSEYSLSQKQYSVTYVNDNVKTITTVNYGVVDNEITISSTQSFAIQPPQCNSPVKSCSSTNLPTGVLIDSNGKIYTEGEVNAVTQTDVTVICTDGTSEVIIPLKITIGSNSGSSPVQYFKYPTNEFNFHLNRAASLSLTYYYDTISKCECEGLASGISLNSNTCVISGTLTTIPPETSVKVTITASNDFSKSEFIIELNYLADSHDEYQTGFLFSLYKFESGTCNTAYLNQDTSSAVLQYIAVRDYINYTVGKTL